jgi:hypothetical protein
MIPGVRAARHDVLMFFDGDVYGRTEESIRWIVEPVLQGRYEMYVGVRARSTLWLNRLLHFFPILGGERALTRRLWEALPRNHKKGFQIEIALNYTAKQFDRGMGFELINGTVHQTKEQKYGLSLGLLRRLDMISDVLSISFRLYIVDAAGRLVGRLGRTLRSLGRTG